MASSSIIVDNVDLVPDNYGRLALCLSRCSLFELSFVVIVILYVLVVGTDPTFNHFRLFYSDDFCAVVALILEDNWWLVLYALL